MRWAWPDPAGATIVLVGKHTGAQYQQGTYLLSIGAFTVKYLGAFTSVWDEDAQLFVTNANCTDAPALFQAFDYSGKMQCIQMPTRSKQYISPDGHWVASLQGGFVSLQARDQPVVSINIISKEPGTQVIWSPDSLGFFFVAKQVLYFVSLPIASIQTVYQPLNTDKLDFQWLK